MERLKILISDTSAALERKVSKFLESNKLLQANFQRNLFYGRDTGDFDKCLTETFTAFILYESIEDQSQGLNL